MVVTLPQELTIAEVQALRERLLTALGGGAEVVLDGGGVTEIDAAGLQILCAARRSAAARGVQLTLRAPDGGPLARALETSGLAQAADGAPVREGA